MNLKKEQWWHNKAPAVLWLTQRFIVSGSVAVGSGAGGIALTGGSVCDPVPSAVPWAGSGAWSPGGFMAAFSLLCVVRVIYGTTRGAGGICTSQGEKGGCPKQSCPPQAGWVGQGRQQHSARCSAGAEVP